MIFLFNPPFTRKRFGTMEVKGTVVNTDNEQNMYTPFNGKFER